jgi:hypothetical protein
MATKTKKPARKPAKTKPKPRRIGKAVDEVLTKAKSKKKGKAKAKPAPEKPAAQTMPDEYWNSPEHRALREIEEANAEVGRKELDYLTKKKIASEAKKAMESAVQHLRDVIARHADDEPNLFTAAAKPSANGEQSATGPKPAAAPTAADDESWKTVPLKTLGLAAGILKSLEACADGPITTVGELQKYQEPLPNGYTRRLGDIKGIGKGKGEQIENALIAFWESRNRAAAKPVEASPSMGETQAADGVKTSVGGICNTDTPESMDKAPMAETPVATSAMAKPESMEAHAGEHGTVITDKDLVDDGDDEEDEE